MHKPNIHSYHCCIHLSTYREENASLVPAIASVEELQPWAAIGEEPKCSKCIAQHWARSGQGWWMLWVFAKPGCWPQNFGAWICYMIRFHCWLYSWVALDILQLLYNQQWKPILTADTVSPTGYVSYVGLDFIWTWQAPLVPGACLLRRCFTGTATAHGQAGPCATATRLSEPQSHHPLLRHKPQVQPMVKECLSHCIIAIVYQWAILCHRGRWLW